MGASWVVGLTLVYLILSHLNWIFRHSLALMYNNHIFLPLLCHNFSSILFSPPRSDKKLIFFGASICLYSTHLYKSKFYISISFHFGFLFYRKFSLLRWIWVSLSLYQHHLQGSLDLTTGARARQRITGKGNARLLVLTPRLHFRWNQSLSTAIPARG